ncbi:hypothetical protein CASFOL_039213 [Castilleja foliolosa]|uniref:Transmembrane protein n=1 Tax=Castilleja foliolosa TaxID=1961234 RepID=A0ABD3BI01_9LAMI
MPLQWKKAMMNTRVSQLVKDHLHRSQKRRDGSSLFVETGFPTSLVDLFIKNREKLKKPSKKKHQNPNPVVITGSTSVSPPHSPMVSPLITELPPRSQPMSPTIVFCEGSSEKNRILGPIVGLDERECVDESGVDANTVLLVVLKICLVVVLALGTKRLTVGITISAFVLFFLEFVGKQARRFVLKPRFNNVVKLDKKVLNEPDYENHEIQVVESIRYPEIEMETQHENEMIEVSCNQRRLGYQEVESDEVTSSSTFEVEELKKKSRKSKIKSKMTKLVPKKLRSSRKEPGPQTSKIIKEEEANSVWLSDERVVQYEESSELLSVSSRIYKEDDDKLNDVQSEMDEKREEIECGLNWRYLVPIVLAGLTGGRCFAIILTISWFLILKFGEKYMKVPMIKQSN